MALAIVEPGSPAVFVEVKDVKPTLILGVLVTAWRREQFSYATFYFKDKVPAPVAEVIGALVAADANAALGALLVLAYARGPGGVNTVHVNPAIVVPGGYAGAITSFHGSRNFRTGAVCSFHGCGDFKT